MIKKLSLIIIVTIFAALLIGLIYYIFFLDFGGIKEPKVIPVVNTEEETQNLEKYNEENSANSQADYKPRKIGVEDLKSIASSFAERFGSYSNHSNFSNIIDLKIFMSKKMQNWADDYVDEMKKKNQTSTTYFGVTTKAISQTAEKFDDNLGISDILVRTQRRENSGAIGNATVKYQDILVSFIKENGAWKVDGAEWK